MLTCLLHCPEGALKVRLLHASACDHRGPFKLGSSFAALTGMYALASRCRAGTQRNMSRHTQCRVFMLDEGVQAQHCTPSVLIEACRDHLFTDDLQAKLSCQTLDVL